MHVQHFQNICICNSQDYVIIVITSKWENIKIKLLFNYHFIKNWSPCLEKLLSGSEKETGNKVKFLKNWIESEKWNLEEHQKIGIGDWQKLLNNRWPFLKTVEKEIGQKKLKIDKYTNIVKSCT